MKDCKEFQGELFGISNLFRDLSNELFTSEIVESSQEHEKENHRNHSAKLDLVDFGICFDPSKKEITAEDSVKSELNEPEDKRERNPMLEDLGELPYLKLFDLFATYAQIVLI